MVDRYLPKSLVFCFHPGVNIHFGGKCQVVSVNHFNSGSNKYVMLFFKVVSCLFLEIPLLKKWFVPKELVPRDGTSWRGKSGLLMSKSTICHIAFFLLFFRSIKLVIFVVPGGTAIQAFDYLALNNLTRQLRRHPLNNVARKTVIWRKSAELFCEMVESKIIKSLISSATKHNKKDQCWQQINKFVLCNLLIMTCSIYILDS